MNIAVLVQVFCALALFSCLRADGSQVAGSLREILRGQIEGTPSAYQQITAKLDRKEGKEPLSIHTGDIINLRSTYLDKYCNVGDASEDPPFSLRCNEDDTAGANDGLLIIGKNFATNKIYNGDSIYLKSQRRNKFCKAEVTGHDNNIVCQDMQFGKQSEFVVSAGRSDGTFYLVPASDPDRTCYVEPHGHSHFMRCDRHLPKHHTELLEAEAAGSSQGGGDWPSGGGDWPSGGGDWPSGGGEWPSGSGGDVPREDDGNWPTGPGDWPSGEGNWPSGGGDWPSGGRHWHGAPDEPGSEKKDNRHHHGSELADA